MSKGYTQVYTGDGKGKTTAALGLAMRAAGAGHKVFIGQFIKGSDYSELHSFERISDQVTIRQFGRGCFIFRNAESEDVKAVRAGLEQMKEVISSGDYKVVIFDEVNIATFFDLVEVEELLEIIDSKPSHVELVFTGRCADERLLDRADLVTEMCERKHYYRQGVLARVGIES